MIRLIEDNRDAIEALCRRFHVAKLEVFGSAATGAFDPARSDVDFLVEFHRDVPMNAADQYFGLLFALEEIFGRKIDLVTSRSIRNPYFLRGVNETRQPFYVAAVSTPSGILP